MEHYTGGVCVMMLVVGASWCAKRDCSRDKSVLSFISARTRYAHVKRAGYTRQTSEAINDRDNQYTTDKRGIRGSSPSEGGSNEGGGGEGGAARAAAARAEGGEGGGQNGGG